MANKGQENLIPMNERSEDEVRELGQKGGIRSGEVRREKATMKKVLEMMLNTTNQDGETYQHEVTLGLIANAIDKTKGGSPEAYKTILSVLGELQEQTNDTPSLNITITDNSNLEKVLYESEE